MKSKTQEDIEKLDAVMGVFWPPDPRIDFIADWYKRYKNGVGRFMTNKYCIVLVNKKKGDKPVVSFASYCKKIHVYEDIAFSVGT